MTRLMEAPDWVVMAWRCADEEQAMRRASRLHSQADRDEFMRRYRALSHEREVSGDSRVADALIRRGETRLARRQPLVPEQVFVLMQALGDSAVVAPGSDCVLVLGSLLGPWYPRGCHDRKAAYMLAMSDAVAGIVIDGDDIVPIYQGWSSPSIYVVGDSVVDEVRGSSVIFRHIPSEK